MNWSDVLNAQMMGRQPQDPMAPQGPAPLAQGAGPRRPQQPAMPPPTGQPPVGPPSVPPQPTGPGMSPNSAPLQKIGPPPGPSLMDIATGKAGQQSQIAKLPGQDISADQRARMDLYTRLAGLGGMEAQMTRQQALANELREGGEMPGMRGGGTVAAHPLEFLGSTLSDIGGSFAGRQARATEDAYQKQRAAELAKYRESMGFLPDVANINPR